MDGILGLLRIRVQRGINLAIRDVGSSSDPYVVVTMGKQTLKTRVVKNNCNPVWNEELTLSVLDLNELISFTVFDKDTFTADDEMGQGDIDIQPYVEALKMGMENLPEGCVIKRVQPTPENCLADESLIYVHNHKVVQDMLIRLKKVECGEVAIQLEWINLPGCKGLGSNAI